MKKIILIMFLAVMVLGLVACAETPQNKPADKSSAVEETNKKESDKVTASDEMDAGKQEIIPASSEKNVLVVYFSVTGNTRGSHFPGGI